MPATAFQKFPAPSPSSNRPPLITSIDAAALAIIGGSRIARLVTSGKNRSRSVLASRSAMSEYVSR